VFEAQIVAGHGQVVPAVTSSASTNKVVEEEYQRLQAQDDAAQAEVDKWTRENAEARAKGGGISDEDLQKRIDQRVAPVNEAYEKFLRAHPDHARAHLTYGCFLNDRQNEAGAQAEWEKALVLDPGNPDVYNNLAGRYTESGPVKKAFEYYEKAIAMNPQEPLYYHNFASSMYVLRNKAATHYGIDEQQVFARIIGLYSNSVRLAPTNFTYATDLAQTYYSMRPFPAEAAISAWSNTLAHAHNQLEREEAYIHLARTKMLAGHIPEARAQLNAVTNAEHWVLKSNLLHNIEQRGAPASENAQPRSEKEKQQ
jgi:tetratricopeptide (TPR) repeat protein